MSDEQQTSGPEEFRPDEQAAAPFPPGGRPTSPASGAAAAAAARAAYAGAPRAATPPHHTPAPDTPADAPAADAPAAGPASDPATAAPTNEAAPEPASGPGDVAAQVDEVFAASTADEAPPAGSDAALAAERLADLQRLHAEYVNYKRRVDRDRELTGQLALAGFVESMLPVLDEITLARAHGELDSGPFAKIADKLDGVLAKAGVESYGAVGEPFDPTMHEALMHTHADLPPGTTETTIVMVMQPGYRLGDRIIRAARVSVADPH